MEDRLEAREWVRQGKAAPRVGGIPGAFPKPGGPSFPFSGGGAFLANVSVSRASCSAFSAISPLPSALQCCKPRDSCKQESTQGFCPGAALRLGTVSALLVGRLGSHWAHVEWSPEFSQLNLQ